MRHLDKTAGTQRVLENGIQADTGKDMQANTQIERGIEASRPWRTGIQAWVWWGGLCWLERGWCGVELSILVSESSEGGYSVELGRLLLKEESSSRRGKERERKTDGEWGKVRTMTQGHEPHGDGGGREELLIRACGISYGYHRTDGVLPSWRLLSRHPVAITPWGTSSTPAWLFEQGELEVKFTREAVYPQGVMKHKLTVNDFLAFYLSWIHSRRAESHDFPPRMPFSQSPCDWRVHVENTASLSEMLFEFHQKL